MSDTAKRGVGWGLIFVGIIAALTAVFPAFHGNLVAWVVLLSGAATFRLGIKIVVRHRYSDAYNAPYQLALSLWLAGSDIARHESGVRQPVSDAQNKAAVWQNRLCQSKTCSDARAIASRALSDGVDLRAELELVVWWSVRMLAGSPRGQSGG